jgi:GNAT superfamily N-acetyltransferase
VGKKTVDVWGVALVMKGPVGYDYQLFVWVGGAYRNLGLGGALLDTVLSLSHPTRSAKILLDFGEEESGSANFQERKAAWLRLYGQRGFTREFDSTRLRLTLQM